MTNEEFDKLTNEMDRLLNNRDVKGMIRCMQAAIQAHPSREDYVLLRSVENAYHYRRFREYQLSMSCADHAFRTGSKLVIRWYSAWRQWYQPYNPVVQEILKETEELRKKGLI